MPGIVRTISLQQWARELRALEGRFASVAAKGLRAAGMRAVALLQERSNEGPFDTGAYRRGWRSEVGEMKLTVSNAMPYSGVIEEGRRPGARMPPPQVLLPWVRRKLKATAREAPSVAFLVARAIGRRGLPGHHVLRGASPEIERFVAEEVGHSVREALEGGER